MKKNEKYLEAANLIENRNAHYCCHALEELYLDLDNFKELYEPDDNYKAETGYWNAWFTDDTSTDKQNRLARVIALQLMYEMGVE